MVVDVVQAELAEVQAFGEDAQRDTELAVVVGLEVGRARNEKPRTDVCLVR